MKFLQRTLADVVWIVHFLVIVLVLFGWLIPSMWYYYMSVVAGALLSELFLGHCFLSKWEFDMRKKINPQLDYDYSYASYYTYKFTHQHLSPRFLGGTGMVFTTLSLVINVYFKFIF